MKRTLRMITVLALVLALCCVTAAATGSDASQAGGDKPSASQNDMTPPQGGGGAELQVLVEQGIISQDTLDAILKFMEENRPALPGGDNGQNGNPPEKPNGQQPGNAPQMPDEGGQRMSMLNQELLEQLLDADVITQDEYDAILAFQQASQDTAQVAQG